MKKIKSILLFVTLLILLVGAASATEISEDTSDTDSITEEVMVKDMYTLPDKNPSLQDNNYEYTVNESTTKTIGKNKENTNFKEASEITNWEQFVKAVKNTEDQIGNITITLGNGTYKTDGTIIFNNSNAVITIDGNGQTIDGNKQQAFIIGKDASVVLKNITINNCQSQYAGAIYNWGTLTIKDSTIANNTANLIRGVGGVGGAIYNNIGTLTITQSTLTNNTADYQGAVGGVGGAIYNRLGRLIITQSTLTNNQAQHKGGAILSTGRLNITQSTLTNNLANQLGGAIYIDQGENNITDCVLNNNMAGRGGAIENHGVLKLQDSTLNQNYAAYEGGAIFNDNYLIIKQSTLNNNTALSGGAIDNRVHLEIIESTLTNNTARWGGALCNEKTDDFTILNSNITNNHANNGGAIFSERRVTLTGNRFTENTANNRETIDLSGWVSTFNANKYESTDIDIETLNLSIEDKSIFNTDEKIILNFTISLKNPKNYDEDILERLDDITIYINGKKNITTKYQNYTLSNLKPGKYSVYIETCNQKSNTVNFTLLPKITDWKTLREALQVIRYDEEDITLTLENGTYTNIGTLTWSNKNIVLTIDGNGQTIDGNQNQVFKIDKKTSVILKNITIQNAATKGDGGAI